MLKNSILLEGTLRKSRRDGWVFETHDRKLYRIEDLLPAFAGPEVRLILTELQDIQELQEALENLPDVEPESD